MIAQYLLVFVLLVYSPGINSQASPKNNKGDETLAKGLSKAWHLELHGAGLDPTGWSESFRNKAFFSGLLTTGIAFLGGPITHMVIFFVLSLGLVHMGYPLLVALLAAYCGYRRNLKVWFAAGCLASYLLAFKYPLERLVS